MSIQIFAGLFTEGTTDDRFLESVVRKTLEVVAYDCHGQIETELITIKINKTGLSFVEQVLEASQTGFNDFGITLLCVHTDADYSDDSNVMEAKISPAILSLNEKNEAEFCKILVSVIPVHMTEAWMLADKELLKSEIGTQKTNYDLGIHPTPERIANPKETIINAIRIVQSDSTRRQRNRGLDISELYQIIGQKIELSQLENLDSYRKFKESLESAFRKLGYLT